MPLYIAQSGDLDRCYQCLTHWLTDSQTLKDRATQLLIKYKTGALVTQYINVPKLTPGLTMPAFLSAPRNNVLNTDLFWAAYSIEYLANIQRIKLSSFVLQYFFNLYYWFGPVSGAALTRALCHELIRGCLHCMYFQQTNTIISKRAPNHQDLRNGLDL